MRAGAGEAPSRERRRRAAGRPAQPASAASRCPPAPRCGRSPTTRAVVAPRRCPRPALERDAQLVVHGAEGDGALIESGWSSIIRRRAASSAVASLVGRGVDGSRLLLHGVVHPTHRRAGQGRCRGRRSPGRCPRRRRRRPQQVDGVAAGLRRPGRRRRGQRRGRSPTVTTWTSSSSCSTSRGTARLSSRRSPRMKSGREPFSAASTCLAPSMPVSTSTETSPARVAPRMSVSSRSPMNIAVVAPKRSTAAVEDRRLGLARDHGQAPDGRVHGGDERAVAGSDAALRRDRPVGVRRDPRDVRRAARTRPRRGRPSRPRG